MKILTESQLRSAVRHLFEMNDDIVKISDVVDPSAALTNPGNPDYKPDSRIELMATLQTLLDDVPDEKASDAYDAIKKSLETVKDKEEDEGDAKMKTDKVEETIRLAVRKFILEARKNNSINEAPKSKEEKAKELWASLPPPSGPLPPVTKLPPGAHGGEHTKRFEKNVGSLKGIFKKMNMADYEPEGAEETAPGRKNVMVSDVGGSSFKEISQELGFAHESGAKQAVEKAIAKMKTRFAMDPDELEIAVLTTMNDYIEELRASGELSPADVQLLKDHPDIVRELEGFREYLSGALRKLEKEKR